MLSTDDEPLWIHVWISVWTRELHRADQWCRVIGLPKGRSEMMVGSKNTMMSICLIFFINDMIWVMLMRSKLAIVRISRMKSGLMVSLRLVSAVHAYNASGTLRVAACEGLPSR